MHRFYLTILLLLALHTLASAQAVFQSNGSGNWDNPGNWTLLSGSSSTNYPVSGDTATITAAAIITVDVNSQCNQLTINGGASLLLNSAGSILTVSNALVMTAAASVILDLGLLTVTGSMSVAGASTITVNQGALTVVGFMALNTPTSSTGNTLLDVEGGAFSCAGGMTITGATASRTAELRIGNSAVNVVGGLATFTGNAHINFTGTGALTLAGAISIPNAASFSAGSGRVVYFGIPGSGQTVAPLTYYRLVITGVGSGTKQINGAVVVTDTLTLLIDTLSVGSGGSLTLNNGITIVRTGGKLLSTPVFLGTADLVYNDVGRDTTGPEMPSSPAVLNNLTINDIGGIDLGASVTVNNILSLQQGPLLTDNYILNIANPSGGPTTDPAINRTNGYVLGKIERTIGATAGIRIFPFGTAGFPSNYREFNINYSTAPASPGILTLQHADSAAPGQSGLPLNDGSISIVKRHSTGGPWVLDGTAGVNSGTNAVPVVVRQGMSGFSQFSFGSDNTNTLPISLLYFSGSSSGSNIILSWATASEYNNQYFTIEHSQTGGDFTAIGQLAGAGASYQEKDYSFTHWNAPSGKNYYRLQLTDLDGNNTYSNTIVLNRAPPGGLNGAASGGLNAAGTLKVFPVPATSSVFIGTDNTGGATIQLFNAAGQYLKDLSAGLNDISQLPKGVYYVRSRGSIARFVKE